MTDHFRPLEHSKEAAPLSIIDRAKEDLIGALRAQPEDAWKNLFFSLAKELKCLPSSFVDGNDHVLRKARELQSAAPSPAGMHDMTPSPEPEKAVPVVAWKAPRWKFYPTRFAAVQNCEQVVDALIRLTDHEAAMAAVRAEVERLRGVIRDHNEDCERQCQARQAAGSTQCPMKGYRRNCGDCPREGMVDTAIPYAKTGQHP